MNDELLERGFFNNLATKTGAFASKVGNAATATAGHLVGSRSPKSRGRLSVRIIADELTHRWEKYLAAQQYGGTGMEGNINDLYKFIAKYFGDDALEAVKQSSPAMSPMAAAVKAAGDAKQAQTQTPPVATAAPAPTAPVAAPAPAQPYQRNFGKSVPPSTNSFGKKGLTNTPFPSRQGAPSELRATAPEQAPTRPVFNSPNQRPTFGKKTTPEMQLGTIRDALNKANPEQKKAIIQRIRNSIQQYPDLLTKYPQLSVFNQRQRVRVATESQEYKDNLLEFALKASEVNKIMLRLAAYEYANGSMKVGNHSSSENDYSPMQHTSTKTNSHDNHHHYHDEIVHLVDFTKEASKHRINSRDSVAIEDLLRNNGGQMRVDDIKRRLRFLKPDSIAALYHALKV